jgi:site-specific DNA-methyltransferase (adenine-specific)
MIDLYQGDCIDIMQNLINQGAKVDAIITDPPYGTTVCKWDSIIPFEPMWNCLNKLIKDNGAIVLFGSEPFSSALRMSNIKEYKYDLIWNKNKGCQPQLANIQPMKSHENITIFGYGRLTYNPQFTQGKPYHRNNKGSSQKDNMIKTLKPIKQLNDGFRYPVSIINCSRDFSAQTRVHPTQKPVALMEYLVKTYTNEGETVLDFTMGSGTTGVACKNLNRNFIGIELEKEYFDIAKERIDKISECEANK